MIFLFVYKYRLYQLVYPNQHLPVQSIEQHSYTRYDTRSQLTKTVKSFWYIINFGQTFEYNKAGLKHFLIVNSYKTTGETTYDDDLTPVLSLFTGISYFIKPYCWIIFFFTLAASILRESLIQTFKKIFSSYFFIFSFRSSQEVKCSPKQNFFDSIIFFYITLKLLEKYFQGPIIRENPVLPN